MNKEENGYPEDLFEDVDDISEDTDEILEDTASIDKKTTLLIALWIIDKVIMAALIIFLGRS